MQPANAVIIGDEAHYVAGIGKQMRTGANRIRLIIALDVRKALATDGVHSLQAVANLHHQLTIRPPRPAQTAPRSHGQVA